MKLSLVSGAQSWKDCDGCFPPERLGDRVLRACTIRDNRLPRFRMSEQGGEQIPERAMGRLPARRKEQSDMSVDFLVRERSSIELRVDKCRNHIFFRLSSASFHDWDQESCEFIPGDFSGSGIVSTTEKTQRPTVKLLFAVSGKP